MINLNYTNTAYNNNILDNSAYSVARAAQQLKESAANSNADTANTNSTDTYTGAGVTLSLSNNALTTVYSTRAAATSSSTPVLKVGSKGSAVTQLQKNLTTLGYDTKGTDGVFGNNTKSAVISFQKAFGLTADGIVGSATHNAIAKALDYHNKGILWVGSRGSAVSQLQKNLTKLGYNTNGTDGIFGNDTKNAVLAFQKANKLTQDGIVGSSTQKAINAALSKLSQTPPVNSSPTTQGTSLSASGYQLLVELELGTNLSQYSYIRLDSNGNISHIRNHDVGDGGTTVGVGIYVNSGNKSRIKMLESLGIDWQDTTQWVPIDKVEQAFENIAQSYADTVNQTLSQLNVKVSQEQFDALFLMAYNRPALLTKGGAVYNMLASKNTNMNDWRNAMISEYKKLSGWSKYGNGWTNRIDDELELYFSKDYKRTH